MVGRFRKVLLYKIRNSAVTVQVFSRCGELGLKPPPWLPEVHRSVWTEVPGIHPGVHRGTPGCGWECPEYTEVHRVVHGGCPGSSRQTPTRCGRSLWARLSGLVLKTNHLHSGGGVCVCLCGVCVWCGGGVWWCVLCVVVCSGVWWCVVVCGGDMMVMGRGWWCREILAFTSIHRERHRLQNCTTVSHWCSCKV